MSSATFKRIYHELKPNEGFPVGDNLYYECVECGKVLKSRPHDSITCACGNVAIDVDYGRISIKDHNLVKLFSE